MLKTNNTDFYKKKKISYFNMPKYQTLKIVCLPYYCKTNGTLNFIVEFNFNILHKVKSMN